MSAQLGQPAFFAQRHFQGRTLSPAAITCHCSLRTTVRADSIPNSAGPSFLGKASQELLEGFEIVKDAQQHTLRKFKPGASCREISLAHNEFMKQKGVPPESRVYSHSQGYDLIERPLIRSDETMNLEKGHEHVSSSLLCDELRCMRTSATTTWSKKTASANVFTRRQSRSSNFSGIAVVCNPPAF